MRKDKFLKPLLSLALSVALVLALGVSAMALGQDDSKTGASYTEAAPEESKPSPSYPEYPPQNSTPGLSEDQAVSSEPKKPSSKEESDSEPTEDESGKENDIQSGSLVLDAYSIVVYTYAELKTALGNNNGYINIYLGANITADLSGVAIHTSKASVVIDGHPPDTTPGVNYSFTQYDVAEPVYSIRVETGNTTTKSVTVRNATLVGKNFAGIIYVREAIAGVVVSFENVTYTGPAPVLNRSGTARFIGGTYTMQPSVSSVVEEMAEANKVEMGGTITVTKVGTVNALVWLTNAATSFTVLPNARISINLGYYFMYTDAALPDITFGAGSTFSLIQKAGFTYADQALGNFRIAENASVLINQDSPYAYAGLYISKLLEMQAGSSLELVRTGTVSVAAIRFPVTGGRAVFNNPKRVAIYTNGNVSMHFVGSGSLSMTTYSLNRWRTASSVNQAAPATYSWKQEGGTAFTVTGTYSDATVLSLTSTLTANAPNPAPLNAANFNLEQSQLITFGALSPSDNRLAFVSVPASIHFESVPVPAASTLVFRQESGFTIAISDTRLSTSGWRVEASLVHPLTTTIDGREYTLPGTMVYVNTNGVPLPLNEEPTTVYTQATGQNGNFFIQWADNQGILLDLVPGATYSDTSYATTILWGLVDAP